MEHVDYRAELHRYIDQANDQMIRILHAIMLEDKRAKEVVGHSVDGSPLTATTLRRAIEFSEAQIDTGDYTTQEDLKKEAEDW